jgi:hypothetical protein
VNEEGVVRERFAQLQAALKKPDVDKLWLLLSRRSQGDADKAAKTIRAASAEANRKAKAEQEKVWGLKAAELAELTGKDYLKTTRFVKKYAEVTDGNIDRVEVQGDSATVHYRDPEGEDEKVLFVREDGQWKAWLGIPRAGKP